MYVVFLILSTKIALYHFSGKTLLLLPQNAKVMHFFASRVKLFSLSMLIHTERVGLNMVGLFSKSDLLRLDDVGIKGITANGNRGRRGGENATCAFIAVGLTWMHTSNRCEEKRTSLAAHLRKSDEGDHFASNVRTLKS